MFSLFGIFLIATPLVILYARGYTYDFFSKNIYHGGALSIETAPLGATVFINDIKLKQLTPIHLTNVLPQNYHVRIEQPNMYAWEKDINIVSNETTYLHDIDLFQKKLPREIELTNSMIEKIYPSENTNVFLIERQNSQNFEYSLFHMKENMETLLTRIISTSTPQIDVSPNGDLIKIGFELKKEKNILLFNPQNPFITQSGPYSHQFQWQESSVGTKYLYQNGLSLEQMDTHSTKNLFTLSTSTVDWFIDTENTLWEYSDNEVRHYQENKQVFSSTVTRPVIKFIDVNDKRIIGFDGQNMVIYLRNTIDPLQEQVLPLNNYRENKAQNYFLTWKDGELWDILPDGSANLLNRFSETIEDVIPLTEQGTLLLITSNKLIAFHPQYSLPQTLFEGEGIQNFNIYKNKREIYILKKESGVNKLLKLEY